MKVQEAENIGKTYKLILERLRTERSQFDQQLQAVENSLRGKEHDLEELQALSCDARNSMVTANL